MIFKPGHSYDLDAGGLACGEVHVIIIYDGLFICLGHVYPGSAVVYKFRHFLDCRAALGVIRLYRHRFRYDIFAGILAGLLLVRLHVLYKYALER